MTKVPLMTLTASAPASLQDIIQSLSFTNVVYVKHSLPWLTKCTHISSQKTSLAISEVT